MQFLTLLAHYLSFDIFVVRVPAVFQFGEPDSVEYFLSITILLLRIHVKPGDENLPHFEKFIGLVDAEIKEVWNRFVDFTAGMLNPFFDADKEWIVFLVPYYISTHVALQQFFSETINRDCEFVIVILFCWLVYGDFLLKFASYLLQVVRWFIVNISQSSNVFADHGKAFFASSFTILLDSDL